MLKKRWLIVLLVTVLILAGAIGMDAYFFATKRITVNYETLSSSKIPEDLSGMGIAVFGDLEYGEYLDQNRLKTIVDKINSLDPDTIIFLGDLFNENYNPSEDEITVVTSLLSTLKAAEGKFAVLGDFDNEEIVTPILNNAGFEVIGDKVIHLHHGTSAYVDLIGLNNTITGSNDLDTLFKDIQTEVYNIAICHNPEIVNSLPLNTTDVLFAAHSHGYEITIPLYGAYSDYTGTDDMGPGKHLRNGTEVYVTNGIGTVKSNIRLFSDPEIILFRLKN